MNPLKGFLTYPRRSPHRPTGGTLTFTTHVLSQVRRTKSKMQQGVFEAHFSIPIFKVIQMKSASENVRGKVNGALLDKADRLFRNDDAGIWTEILQNARRAGANSVDLTIKPGEPTQDHCVITFQDDGRGIEDFQSLLTLGTSDWDAETQSAEDPAGMGFFSLCRSQVEVYSGNRYVKLTPAVFLGKAEAHVETGGEFIQGTRLHFTRQSTRDALIAALKQVTEFCPIEVRLEGQSLPRHDFLAGALYRELIDGIEVGFGVAFEHGYSYYHDGNWNFYGTRIHHPFVSFTGLLDDNKRSVSTIYARFNVLETGRVKLQLPDRRGIIEDEFLKEFERKSRAAAYRFFQTQSQHVLPFRNWKEAKGLGIDLPEAAQLLTSWHAESRDESIEPLFGYPETGIIADLTSVILADNGLLNGHTLDAALHSVGNFPGNLYREEPGYAGYAWYDRLPQIADTTVFVDGVSFEEYEPPRSGAERPARIEIEITIKQVKGEGQGLRVPAFIHVDTSEVNEVTFVAVKQSPWDNENLAGPFPIVDFLIWATFSASDDFGECDSWATQAENYEEDVRRIVNEYFRGPRATLLGILRNAVQWDASSLAERLGVTEIRFKRTASGRHDWNIELTNADGPVT
jgi:hypothetical protein